MQDLRIEVDILCSWQTEPPVYRLYIDNDLYTERTYIWRNPHQWIREIIVAELDIGQHLIRVEPVFDKSYKNFRFQHFAVNNQFQVLTDGKFLIDTTHFIMR